MNYDIQYYCVGYIWGPESHLSRFIKDGIWENGFDDRYRERVNSVPVGSKIAAKTTYTRKDENNEPISVLEIHCIGTVIGNPQNGKTLNVSWSRKFKPFTIEGKGAYRSTINQVNNRQNIELIFGSSHSQRDLNTTLGEIVCYTLDMYKQVIAEYPCFVFIKKNWDDFTYKTMYEVDFYESARRKLYVGSTKILNQEEGDTNIPDIFSFLDEGTFCSLGQSNSYYATIKKYINKEIAEIFFDAINDVVYNRGLLDVFENSPGFKTSLIRSSEAQKALREGYKIYYEIPINNTFRFKFATQIGKATKPHKVDFNFGEIENLPNRINVIIGKNGTGKTQYIARLASTLSGYDNEGTFSTKYVPPFSRVLAISYSLFDRFPKPEHSKKFSYHYCGFQSEKGFLTEKQIQNRIIAALKKLEETQRLQIFGKYLAIVLSDDIVLDLLDEDFFELNSKGFRLYDINGYSKYSSGQIIMMLTLSEIVAYIREESLLIFDEPETHLHPNSISLFIEVIYKLLKKFNSYAIVSTHSPQIVQEIPSRCIKVFERMDDTPTVKSIDIETFGENLNTITERIFQTNSHDEYFRKYFIALSEKHEYEYIVDLFNKNSLPLSLSAKIFLQSLYLTDEELNTTTKKN